MSAAGDELDSGDSANALGDVYIGGVRVEIAFSAHAGSEIVAVDTGCNCIVLINAPVHVLSDTVTYEPVVNILNKHLSVIVILIFENLV